MVVLCSVLHDGTLSMEHRARRTEHVTGAWYSVPLVHGARLTHLAPDGARGALPAADQLPVTRSLPWGGRGLASSQSHDRCPGEGVRGDWGREGAGAGDRGQGRGWGVGHGTQTHLAPDGAQCELPSAGQLPVDLAWGGRGWWGVAVCGWKHRRAGGGQGEGRGGRGAGHGTRYTVHRLQSTWGGQGWRQADGSMGGGQGSERSEEQG
jgi:hypothetical protein